MDRKDFFIAHDPDHLTEVNVGGQRIADRPDDMETQHRIVLMGTEEDIALLQRGLRILRAAIALEAARTGITFEPEAIKPIEELDRQITAPNVILGRLPYFVTEQKEE